MRDPIHDLETFDPGAPVPPLPPSEVRRLGDRHRRRRTAGVALAAAAAVAVVATGGAVLAGGDERRSAPDPAPPAPSVTTPRLPDDLDVATGLGEDESGEPVRQERGATGLTELDFCGIAPFADDARVDALSASAQAPEYAETHEVVLYRAPGVAARVLDNLTDAATACSLEESGPDNTTTTTVQPWAAGEDGVVVVSTYGESLGAEILHFTRVGPALLASSTYGEYDPTDTAPAVAEQSAELQEIVDRLCVLGGGCADGSGSASGSSEVHEIPADFPLAAGWPSDADAEPGDDNGLTGPGPDVAAFEDVEVCGTPWPEPASVDRLAAQWANPEDYRTRLLLTFGDADAAIDYQGRFLDVYRACPTSEGSDGYTTVVDVRRTAVGGESWAVVRSFELDGAPAVGLEVIHSVRVGRSILLDATSSEATGADADAVLAEQTTDATAVVAAMCAFTQAGC